MAITGDFLVATDKLHRPRPCDYSLMSPELGG